VLGAVLLALAVVLGLDLHSSRQAIEAQERARLEHQARIVERMLGTRLLATVSALDVLRADAPALLADRDGVPRLNDRMQAMVATGVGVRTVILMNEAGIAVASNRKELIGGDWHEGERYRSIRGNPDPATVYVSPPYLTPLGNWALSIGRAIVGPRGEFDGYVLAIIDPDYFNLLLDSTRYAPDMVAAMAHGGGKVIFQVPDPPGAAARNLADDPESAFGRHVRSGRDQTTTTAFDASTGAETLVVLQNIRPAAGAANAFLVALFSRDAAAVLAPWRRDRDQRIALLAVIGVAAALGLLFGQRRRTATARLEAAHEAERRRQEDALREAEARLRLALEASNAGMWEWDIRTGKNVWSDGLWKLYGVDRERQAASYETWRESVLPEDRERTEEAVTRAAAEGTGFEIEYRVGGRGAPVRWLLARGRPVHGVDGAVERYSGIVVDVTESKHAAARRLENARLDALEEAISILPIGVAISELGADGEPRMVATNPAHQRIVGTKPSSGIAASALPYQAFEPDRVTPIAPRDWPGPLAARTGTPTPLTERHLRLGDGSWRILLATAVPIARASESSPRRAITLLVDVTAEREAASALRASEARYRDLVDLSPNAVFVNRAGQVEFVNRAALALFGAERAEQLIGKSPFDLFHPDFHALMRERLALLQSGSTAPPVLEKIVKLDGTTRDVEVTGAPFQDDRGTAFQVVLRDVTDERRREEALRESEQRFRALFEGAIDGIVTADPSTGRVLACNPAFAAMTGYTEEEIRRLHFEDLHEPQDRPAVGVAFAAMAVGQLRVAEGIPIRRKDGSVFPADITATRVNLPDRSFLAAFFRDVTERRKAAAALQASEARYRLLVEALPVGVTEADAQGRNVYANPACQAIVGRSGEEIRGGGWHDAIHPEDRDRLVRGWYDAVQTGRPFESEYRLARPDGTVREVSGLASALRAPDGAIAGYLGVIRDVTAEKAARAAAEETRATLDAALASMTDAVWVADRDGNFILFNDAFATVHRFASRDDCARTLAAYPEILEVSFPDGTVAPLDQWALPRALRGETATNAEYLLRRKDTGETWVGSYSFAPIRREGAIIGAVVVGRDVTSQKRAEASLRASEQRFRDVVASADEYIFEMSTTGRITYISEAVEGVLGYRPDEVVGLSSLGFMGPEEQERSAAHLAERVERREKISHFQQEAVHRSGRPVWLDISAVPVLDDDGVLVGYRGAALDITMRHLAEQERAALQAQLAQSQKLEGIGRLAGGVAHDFNNILSVILSCAGFALDGLKEGDPLRDDILEIDKGARRAAALTRQLLAFSRKQVLQPVSLDLNHTLGEMEKMLRRIIGEDIDLVQVLAPDLGTVRADPGQVEQVIMNIVVNARDAMPDGGMLTIETANVELDEEYATRHAGSSPGPYAMLAISDSGTGMDEKTLARVFEPFFTTKGPGKGNGLGLSTVYGIVKQSGGSIYVYSEVGRGTTFKVFLPRETSLGTLAPPAPLPAARAVRGETILVVEDDEAVRSIAKRMLAGAGYRVLTAANGGEGLLTCEGHAGEIHLLLTDVVMPQMGGRAFAERLAKVRPGLKVLFMSGYTDDAIVHHGVLEPGTYFVSKPFTQAELLAKVQEALDGP